MKTRITVGKRILAFVLVLFLVFPSGLEAIVNASNEDEEVVRVEVSTDEILSTIEKWAGSEVVEAIKEGDPTGELPSLEAAIEDAETEEYILEKTAPDKVIYDEEGTEVEVVPEESEAFSENYELDSDLKTIVDDLELPYEDENSVIMRKTLLEAVEGKWLVKHYDAEALKHENVQAIMAIDPATYELLVLVINNSEEDLTFKVQVLDAEGNALDITEVSSMIYKAAKQTLTPEELAKYKTAEVIGVTAKLTEEEVSEPSEESSEPSEESSEPSEESSEPSEESSEPSEESSEPSEESSEPSEESSEPSKESSEPSEESSEPSEESSEPSEESNASDDSSDASDDSSDASDDSGDASDDSGDASDDSGDASDDKFYVASKTVTVLGAEAASEDGSSEDGSSEDSSEEDSSEDGSSEDGSSEDGSSEDGSSEDGSSEDGSSEDGSSEDGSSEDSSSEDGSSEDGSSEDGSSEDGSSEDGSDKPVQQGEEILNVDVVVVDEEDKTTGETAAELVLVAPKGSLSSLGFLMPLAAFLPLNSDWDYIAGPDLAPVPRSQPTQYVRVYTAVGLKAVLAMANITYVEFDSDISNLDVATTGRQDLQIQNKSGTLIIDGKGFNYNDYNGGENSAFTISATGTSGLEKVHFKNIKMPNSQTNYGLVVNRKANIQIEIENTTFVGPQLAYMPVATADLILNNVDITIKDQGHNAEEIVQSGRNLYFVGAVNFSRQSRTDGNFTGITSMTIGARPKDAQGSELVNISGTAVTFNSNQTGAFISAHVPVTVKEGASLVMTSTAAMAIGVLRASDLIVEKDATVDVTTSGSTPAIYVYKGLDVQPGSTFRAVNTGSGYAITFPISTGSVNIERPDDFLLYANTAARAVDAVGSKPVTITMNNLSYWNTSQGATLPADFGTPDVNWSSSGFIFAGAFRNSAGDFATTSTITATNGFKLSAGTPVAATFPDDFSWAGRRIISSRGGYGKVAATITYKGYNYTTGQYDLLPADVVSPNPGTIQTMPGTGLVLSIPESFSSSQGTYVPIPGQAEKKYNVSDNPAQNNFEVFYYVPRGSLQLGGLNGDKKAVQVAEDVWQITLTIDGGQSQSFTDLVNADIMLSIDRSGSMSAADIAATKVGAQSMINTMLAQPNFTGDVRLGFNSWTSSLVDTYSLRTIRFGDIKYQDAADEIMTVINGMDRGGTTYPIMGINHAYSEFTKDNPKYNKILILMSDGGPSNPHSENMAAAQKIKDMGGTIVTIGYGSAGTITTYAGYLKELASTPSHFYMADQANIGEVFNTIVADLVKVSNMESGVLTDPIPPAFELVPDPNGSNASSPFNPSRDINNNGGTVIHLPAGVDPETIRWEFNSTTNSASLTYFVKLKNPENYVNSPIATNGETVLEYETTTGGGGSSAELEFDVPKATYSAAVLNLTVDAPSSWTGAPTGESKVTSLYNNTKMEFKAPIEELPYVIDSITFKVLNGSTVEENVTYTSKAAFLARADISDIGSGKYALIPAQARTYQISYKYKLGIVAITVKADDATRTYTGAAQTVNVGGSVSAGSLHPGHTFVSVQATGSGTAVGTYNININPSSVVIHDASNQPVNVSLFYTITPEKGTLTIARDQSPDKTKLGIKEFPVSTVYNSQDHTAYVTANPGTTISYWVGSGWTTTAPKFRNVVNTVVRYKVTSPNYADYENTTDLTVSITPRTLTVRAVPNATAIQYGQNAPGATVQYTGIQTNDTQSSVVLTAPVLSTTYTPTSPVGTYSYTVAGGTYNTNYTPTYVSGTFTVGQKGTVDPVGDLHLVLNGINTPYTGKEHKVSVTSVPQVDGFRVEYYVGGSWVSTAPGFTNAQTTSVRFRVFSTNFATYDSISTGTHIPVSIQKVNLQTVVTLDKTSIPYGTPVANAPKATLSYTGFVNGEGKSVITEPTIQPSGYTATSSVGTYTYQTTGGSATNYNILQGSGSFTVTKKSNPDPTDDLKLKITGINRPYNGASSTVGVVTTGTVAGFKVEYYVGSSWTTTAPSFRNVSESGTVRFKVTSTNYADYEGNITVSITPIDLNVDVKFSSNPITFGDAVPTITAEYRTSDLATSDKSKPIGDVASGSSVAPVGSAYVQGGPAGSYVYKTQGGTAANGNYTLKYNNGTLVVGQGSGNETQLGISRNPVDTVYTGTPHSPSVTATAAEWKVQYKVSGQWQDAAPSFTNVVNTTVEFRVTSRDYAPYESTISVKITPKELQVVVTPKAASIPYGTASAPGYDISYTGFVNGEGTSVITTAPTATLAPAYTSTSPVGTYTYTSNNNGVAANGNYTFKAGSGSFEVTQKSNPDPTGDLKLKITGVDKVYNGLASTVGVVSDPAVDGFKVSYWVGSAWTTTAPSFTHVSESGTVRFLVESKNFADYEGTITVDIRTAPLQVVINLDKTQIEYGTPVANAPKVSSITYTGYVNGEGSSVVTQAPATTLTPAYTATSPVGTYTYTASGGTTNGDYHFVYGSGTSFKVVAATGTTEEDLKLVRHPISKEYDGVEATLSVAVGSHVANPKISYSKDGGTTWTTTAYKYTNAVDETVHFKVESDNYETFISTSTGPIRAHIWAKKLPVIVTVNNPKETQFGKDAPGYVISFDETKLIGSETIATVVTSQPTATTPYVKGDLVNGKVGTYTYTASGGTTNGNYEFEYGSDTFKVVKNNTDSNEGTILKSKNEVKRPYDATSSWAYVEVKDTIQEAKIFYSTDGGTTWVENAVLNFRNVSQNTTVKYKVESRDYVDLIGDLEVTITKVPLNVLVEVNAAHKTIEFGAAQPVITISYKDTDFKGTDTAAEVFSGPGAAEPTFKITGPGNIVGYTPNVSGVGNYTVTTEGGSVYALDNYNLVHSDSDTFEVVKTNSQDEDTLGIVRKPYTGVYDGKSHYSYIEFSKNLADQKVQYSLAPTGPWQDTPISIIHVDETKDIYFQVTTRDYSPYVNTIRVEVTPKPVEVKISVASATIEYQQPAPATTLSYVVPGTNTAPWVIGDSEAAAFQSPTGQRPTVVTTPSYVSGDPTEGLGTFEYSTTGGQTVHGDYALQHPNKVSFTVTKKQNPDPSGDMELVVHHISRQYNTSSSDVKVTVSATKVVNPVIEYRVSSNSGSSWSTWTTTMPSVRNVDDSNSFNNIYEYRVNSDNFAEVTGTVNVTITPMELTVSVSVPTNEITFGLHDAPAAQISYSGFVGTDTSSEVTTGATATLYKNPDLTTPWNFEKGHQVNGATGTYTYKTSGGASRNNNYTFNHSTASASFTVKAKGGVDETEMGITNNGISKVYDADDTTTVSITVDPAKTTGAVIEYRVDGGSWSATEPKVRNVDDSTSAGKKYEYKVTSTNFEEKIGEMIVSITPANLNVVLSLTSSGTIEFGDAAPTYKIDYATLLGTDTNAVISGVAVAIDPSYVAGNLTDGKVGDYYYKTSGGTADHGNYTLKHDATGVKFTVGKKSGPVDETEMGITNNGYTGVYDGTSHNVPITVDSSKTKNPVITYSDDGGATWSATPPSVRNVDDSSNSNYMYKVESDNFADKTGVINVTITPADLNVVLTLTSSSNIAFGDAAPTYDIDYSTLLGGDTKSVISGVTAPTAPNYVAGDLTDGVPGTYYYKTTGGTAAHGNYNLIHDATGVPFVVSKKGSTETEMGITNNGYAGVYDGGSHTVGITINGNTKNPVITYSTDGGATWSNPGAPAPSVRNVDDSSSSDYMYKVTSDNFEDKTGIMLVSITPADLNVVLSLTSSGTIEFKDAAPTYKIDYTTLLGGDTSAVISGVAVATAPNYVAGSLTDGKVGDYYYKTSGGTAAHGNYTLKHDATGVKFTVGKKSGPVDETEMGITNNGYTGVYDGTSHNVPITVDSSKTKNPVITYSDDGGATWSATPPSVRNVDDSSNTDYMYKVVSDNFADKTGVINVTITPADLDVVLTLTSPGNIAFGDAAPAYDINYTTLLGGDTKSVISGVTAPTAPNYVAGDLTDGVPGTYYYKTTGGTAAHGNYNLIHDATGVPFIVSKKGSTEAEMGITNNGYASVYDGDSHTVEITIDNKTKNPVITYSDDGGNTWTATPPTVRNVDDSSNTDYMYKVTSDNFEDKTGYMTVGITPASLVVTPAIPSPTIEYGSATPAVTFQYNTLLGTDSTLPLGQVISTSPTATWSPSQYVPGSNTGTYVIGSTGGAAAHGNYTLVHGNTVPLEVTKKTVVDPGTELGLVEHAVNRTYTGLADQVWVEITKASQIAGLKVEYSTDGVTWTTGITSIKNVDDTIAAGIQYKVSSNNYKDVTGTLAATITPATLTLVPTIDGDAFVGKVPPYSVDYVGFVNGEDKTVLIGTENIVISSNYNPLVDGEGTYTLSISTTPPGVSAKHGNYNVTLSTGVHTFEVKKQKLSDENVQIIPYDGVYDGTPHELVTVVKPAEIPDANVEYFYNGAWSSTPPTETYASEYDVLVRVTGDGVYYQVDPFEKTVSAKIAKKDARIVVANQVKVRGASDPELTATLYDFLPQDIDAVRAAVGRPVREPGEYYGSYKIYLSPNLSDPIFNSYNVTVDEGQFIITVKDGQGGTGNVVRPGGGGNTGNTGGNPGNTSGGGSGGGSGNTTIDDGGVPLTDIPDLPVPMAGGMPIELLGIFGMAIIALGIFLKRKEDEEAA